MTLTREQALDRLRSGHITWDDSQEIRRLTRRTWDTSQEQLDFMQQVRECGDKVMVHMSRTVPPECVNSLPT